MAFGLRKRNEIEIKGAGCRVRSWRRTDKAALIEYADNPKVARNLRDTFPSPYTTEDADFWLSYARSREPETNFAIEFQGRAAGGIGFSLMQDVYRRTAEIGYWIGEPFWGRGIATDALMAVTEYAFENHDLARIYAGVFGWNPASMRVLEKAGYTREAIHRNAITKLDHLLDEHIFVRLRNP